MNTTEIDKFNQFIEFPAVGRRYTWYRPNETARSRIDRVLVSEVWLQYWSGLTQYIKNRTVLDHCVLVV